MNGRAPTGRAANRWTSWRADGLAALLGTSGLTQAAHASTDEVVRIGYLPITDATALLVAHAKGYFEAEGLEGRQADAGSVVVGAGRRLRCRQVQPRAPA